MPGHEQQFTPDLQESLNPESFGIREPAAEPLEVDLNNLTENENQQHVQGVEELAMAFCKRFLIEEFITQGGQPILPNTENNHKNAMDDNIEEIYMAYFDKAKAAGLVSEADLPLFAQTFVYTYQMGYPSREN